MQTSSNATAAPAVEPAIAALRRATAERHQRLESMLKLDAPLSLDRYAAVVHGFELFLAHWEPRLVATLPDRLHGWFRSRSRHELARRDARVLGQAATAGTDEAIGAALHERLRLPTLAAAFGSMYVMEGSVLGGRVIAKRVAETLALGPDSGAAYFNGRGRNTAAQWREFRSLLEAEVGPDRACRQDACNAAQQTFDALISTFRTLQHAAIAA